MKTDREDENQKMCSSVLTLASTDEGQSSNLQCQLDDRFINLYLTENFELNGRIIAKPICNG